MSNYLYPFFWQHGEEQEVLEHYMDKIAASGMKGVCIEARPHPEFVEKGWWHDLDIILSKAKELDMKLWILDDSHFPTGYANGKVKECYPEYLKWYLDLRRYDVQGPMTQVRIDLKLLKGRPWEKPDETVKVLGVYLARRSTQETVQGDPIEADTLTDITGQMRMEDRLLTLDVPEGAYSIFVVFQTRKGAEESTNDYLNPLVKEATQVLIDTVYEPHYAHYGDEFGKTILGFFSDEPRFGNTKGTDAVIGTEMPLPWREGLEKELDFDRKLLPLLWVNAGGVEHSVRFTYMDLVTRLYNENFTKVLGDWCKEHGVWYLGHNIEDNGAHARLGYGAGHYFRAQQDMDVAGVDVIGTQIVPGMNYHHDAFNTGGSNGEFYHYALAKLASSAAHLDPKKAGRTMCEAFGAYGWNEGLRTMKWIADHLMVRGINHIVPHAFDPKKFPDWDCPPHFYAHGHNPQFRYFSVLSSYMNRVMNLLHGGTHPAKVGVFYPAELEWSGEAMSVEKPARVLTENQISFDIVSRDYLLGAKVEKGAYYINSQRFEVLVFPYGERLPVDLLSVLAQMAEAGVKLVFVNAFPLGVVGKAGEETDTAMVLGKAEIVPLKELGDFLCGYKALVTEQPQRDLAVGEYCRQGRHYYFLFNENIGTAVETWIRLGTQGRVYRYDALRDTLYTTEQGEHGVRLSLQPYEAAVLVVSQEPLNALESVDSSSWETAELPRQWQVRFADSTSYPESWTDVPAQNLGFIHQYEGFDNKAGTVQFIANVELENVKDAVLDLGEAHETAEVFVNGVSAGVRLCRPYRFDLDDLVRNGSNEFRIEITNNLGTAIREPLSHYLVIEPFGIEGPVTLKVRKEDNK